MEIIEKRFKALSPFQKSAISEILKGKDVFAVLKNRIERTAAFITACLEKVDVTVQAIQGWYYQNLFFEKHTIYLYFLLYISNHGCILL